jgi:Skp family chaperone for outer membrane proteins
LADDATAPPLKIASCNPLMVFSQIQEGKDLAGEWKQQSDTLTSEATAKKAELESKEAELKLLLPTSSEYEKKVEDLTTLQADDQAWLQAQQVNTARQQREQEQTIFDKILKAINDVAQAQGVTLVINGAHADFPPLDHLDANAFIQTILLHTVLYGDPKLDITQQVIVAMDKAYSATPAPATH